MSGHKLTILVIVICLTVVASTTPSRAHAAGGTSIQIMPSSSTGGMTSGLHFDDGALAARDFGHSSDAYLRGMLYTNDLNLTIRYMYWDEGNCRVRGRLQKYVFGVWSDDYTFDVDIMHLTNPPTSTSYTQTVWTPGDWFYKVVGTASTCGTGEAHSHLGMTLGSYVTWTYGGANETCWANGTECLTMPSAPRRHAPRDQTGTYCPGPWLGEYATSGSPDYKRSGRVDQGGGGCHDPYQCEDWSSFSWGADTAVFTGNL